MSHPAGAVRAIPDAELTTALAGTLGAAPGKDAGVVRLERRASSYRTSFALEEIDAVLADGTILRLMLKDLSPSGLHEAARRAKPAFLYAPRREIETYRSVLAREPMETARVYGSCADESRQRFWLLLERVPGVELYQVGDLAVWAQAARWLAGLHGRLRLRMDRRPAAGPAGLLRYDAGFYRTWLRRARAFARGRREDDGRLAWLADRYDGVVERLRALPTALIHGEFYASNVLVEDRGRSGVRICPVDWEMAGVGPGLIDLAALVAGGWNEEQRQAIAGAYFEAWSALDPSRPVEELRVGLACCRIHLAVRWLGWSADWSPPAEHAQDWLGEAVGLAEAARLG